MSSEKLNFSEEEEEDQIIEEHQIFHSEEEETQNNFLDSYENHLQFQKRENFLNIINDQSNKIID